MTPIASNIVPNSGPTTGGQAFTINGSNLGPDSVVTFGADGLATNVVVASNGNSLTGRTPPGAVGSGGRNRDLLWCTSGPADVHLLHLGHQRDERRPLTSARSPVASRSSSTATASPVPRSFDFGATPRTTGSTVNNDGQITVPSIPAHAAGTVDVTVTTPGRHEPRRGGRRVHLSQRADDRLDQRDRSLPGLRLRVARPWSSPGPTSPAGDPNRS